MGGAATHPQALDSSHPHPRPRSQHFSQGSVVEVQTDEEDFRGVYFSATVVQPPLPYTSKHGGKRMSRNIYVEYHNLLANENGSERLKEYVGLGFVRPSPPSAPTGEPFQPGDVVDAFYKDGWWTGVVKRAVKGAEKYVVTFQYPPDELEFGASDLRVHWDWVDGNWVRPQKQSLAGLMFDVGRKVEVSLDRENCQDAWFPATIHKHLKNGAFLVDYRANNDNKVQTLKVSIDYPYIRPCPPFLKDKNFDLLEKVDAFFDFGWWTGVVTKELENGRYLVFFKQLKRDKEFHHSKLRPHMEWKDGKWFTSSQEVAIQSLDLSMHEQHPSESFIASAVAVPLNTVGEKDTCGRIVDSSQTTGEGNADEMSPDDQKASDVVGAQDKSTHDSSSKDTVCDSISPVSVFNISIPVPQTATRDHLPDNASGGKRISRKERNSDATVSVVKEVDSMPNPMNLTNLQMLQRGSPNNDVGGKELDSVGNTANIQTENGKNVTELPVIIGLPCAEMGISECSMKGKRGCHFNRIEMMNIGSDRKQQMNGSTVQKMKNNYPLETGGSSERNKRGRPRKRSLVSFQTPMSVVENAQNEVAGSDDLNKKSDDPRIIPEVEVLEMDYSLPNQEVLLKENKLPDGHSDPKNERGSKKKRMLSRMLDEVVKKSPGLQGTNSSRRGRRLTQGGNVAAVQFLDSPDESGGRGKEANQAVELENAVSKAPNNELDDEPLSKWIEGMHVSSLIDGSRLSHVSTVDKCMENSKKQGDDIMPGGDIEHLPESGAGSAFADPVSVGPSEPQNLPFVKNAFLWKTIESMEIFLRIPQKPHFKPLENFKESSREGMAIGYMVTFSSVVEKTRRLQFDDPKCVMDDILETLVELERHGFQVKIVQDRVNELLSVKEKQEKLVDEVKVLNEHMLEHNHERARIQEEIKGINEDVRKLQERLLLAEAAKEKQDAEIDSLQSKLKETKDIIDNIESEFDGIASAALGKV